MRARALLPGGAIAIGGPSWCPEFGEAADLITILYPLLTSLEEKLEIVLRQRERRRHIAADRRLEDRRLLLLQLQDALFDRSLDHKLDASHRLELTQAVDPVHRLALHRRIPPQILRRSERA